MRKSLALLLVLVVCLSVGLSSTHAQTIKFNFIVNSATCGSGTVTLAVDADTEVPGVLLQVIQNGTMTVNEIRNHTGVIAWDGGPRTLDGSGKFTKTVIVYNGTTEASGIAVESSYTLECAGRSSGEDALITVCNHGQACEVFNAPVIPAGTYEVAPAPGCVLPSPIPSTAVGATLTATTQVYWAPGKASNETFPAGLTLLAIGVDANQAYTKVVFGCGYYWIPSEVIGPNYDQVWNGAPLPTEVVE